ncbi:MAG: phosphoribosylaminoimidazolesuccinocarboxamide synthase [Candidatus Glassbacteria bacterium]|nr:phosphoribosylaminoimidazolesuccinocarboxamide synthase [Candidatus Glassbacteria bacterium]
MDVIRETSLGAGNLRRGKVRDCYEFDEYLLLVVTDRISAFDVVMPDGIPDKGRVLSQISAFWFDKLKDIVRNHVVTTDVAEIVKLIPELAGNEDGLEGRSLLAVKTEPIAVECVVRAYLAGSAWSEYAEKGTVAEVELPSGMVRSQKFDSPMFTPAIKAESGHDENISIGRMKAMIGRGLSERMIETSFALFNAATEYAATRGMLIADTKFEFGLLDGHLILIDEIFTPDSSRFWMADEYRPGVDQKGFDKQPLRDWLQKLTDEGKWDKTPPAPELPDDVVGYMSELYRKAFRMITGGEVN